MRGVCTRVALSAADERAVHEEGRSPRDGKRNPERDPEERVVEVRIHRARP